MPITFEDILADRKPVTVTWRGHRAEVAYRPTAITPRFLKAVPKDADIDLLVQTVAHLLVDWEITRAGEPVPIEPEAMMDLPIDLLSAVLSAVMDDYNANPQTPAKKPRG